MNKPHYKGVFIFLVLSVRDCSDFLSALPHVKHSKKPEILVIMG